MRILFILIAAFFCENAAISQVHRPNKDSADLETTRNLNPIVVTGTGHHQRLKTTSTPVHVLTMQEMQEQGIMTLDAAITKMLPQASIVPNSMGSFLRLNGLGNKYILILINGKKLSGDISNNVDLNRVNMSRVKRIEVLDGAASSLYGNVALTAVVNVITKSGADMEGNYAEAHVGNNHSYSGTYMFGQGNLRTDILAWASVYTSKGEPYNLDGTTHYVGGYNSKPAYDLGAKLRWGKMNIEVFGQHAKAVPFYNLIEVGNNFSYDHYSQQNSEKPGMSRSNVRVNLDYDQSWKNFSLSLSGFANKEDLQLYNVLGDTVDVLISELLLQELDASGVVEPHTDGVWQSVNWQTYSFGGTASGAYKYKLPFGMYGSAIAGMQYECFTLTDAAFKLGSDYNRINLSSNQVFNKGTEHTLSAFLQMKHNFTSHIIFNGGLRYDHKIRHDHRHLNTVSPRISLVWLPSSVVSIKGAYSHSFVDAPFFYRASNITIFSGGSGLNPEKMDSYQMGVNFNWQPLHLKYDLNLFYNKVHDLVYYNNGNDEETLDKETFANTGAINMGGVENVLQYTTEWTLANLNFTYQYPFKVENFSSTRHNISNVPKFILNLVVAQKCYEQARLGKFWARANMHFQSSMRCRYFDKRAIFSSFLSYYFVFNISFCYSAPVPFFHYANRTTVWHIHALD